MPLRRVFAWLLLLGPFLPALIAFYLRDHAPANVFVAWYLVTNPLVSSAILLFAYTNLLYAIGLFIHNHSIFDFNWSMLPASFFVLAFGLHPSLHPNPLRFWLVFVAVTLWGLRLSGNWLYKGGLSFEDFRYMSFRRQIPSKLGFELFAYVALFLAQGAMVYGMVLPIYVAFQTPTPTGALDYFAFVLILAAVTLELVADAQQFKFRAQRNAQMKSHPELYATTPPTAPRFLQTGLWKYSRHPNYFGEMNVWWGVYLFGVAASGHWLHWSLVGPLTVMGLFLGGSVRITEQHELARKPEYADYQRRVSRLIPWFPKSS